MTLSFGGGSRRASSRAGRSETRGLSFRLASQPWEFEGIHRLNHETFAEEIPQHEPSPEGRLVDRFDAENQYIVAERDGEIVGMIAFRGERPFSIDAKLPDLDRYLPEGRRICELRLLAIQPRERRGLVLSGLLAELWRQGHDHSGYDCAVMSAYVPRVGLYERLGCRAFGPRVGTAEVPFQPMSVTREDFVAAAGALLRRQPGLAVAPAADPGREKGETRALNFLPGPVELTPATRAAFELPALSHRSPRFHDLFSAVRRDLCALTRAAGVEVLVGSGTLANDVVAAQLSLLEGGGVVLTNGEFGDRLVDHARRHRLSCRVVRAPWAEAFSPAAIAAALDDGPPPAWLWAVHCETSTGVLNDAAWLDDACERRGVKLCLDVVSSLGTLPLDLSRVHLAAAASGKALRSVAGLALVFHRERPVPAPEGLPRALDLGLYAAACGVPFTISSHPVAALAAALEQMLADPPFARVAAETAALRRGLEEMGFRVLASPEHSAPAVLTILPPVGVGGNELAERLRQEGILTSFESGYLRERGWFQVCWMSGYGAPEREALLSALRRVATPA